MIRPPAFAVWITGLPASGKSTLTAALKRELGVRGISPAVLESDDLRRRLLPRSTYSDEERDAFYASMVWIGALLVEHGVPVIFDATAHRRAHRDEARKRIARLVEVFVECPLKVCVSRDPKGLYRKGRADPAATVPGLNVEYEAPLRADITVRGDVEAPGPAARRIVAVLEQRGFLLEP